MPPFTLPSGHPRIKVVESFEELVTTRFEGDINALCWRRSLPGNFSEVIERLGSGEGITTLDEALLKTLPLSADGKKAVEILLADQELLRARGLDPVLDCIHGYPRDEKFEVISTDVLSFHADSATVEADTYLCTYHGLTSEGVSNEEVRRHINIPETRASLLELFGGEDDEEFLEFLKENCYDLHYAMLPGARPYTFGIGNLWRVAVQYPGSPVLPCIHRAPETLPGQSRLLLIS